MFESRGEKRDFRRAYFSHTSLILQKILNWMKSRFSPRSLSALLFNYSKTSTSEHLVILNTLKSHGAFFAGNAPKLRKLNLFRSQVKSIERFLIICLSCIKVNYILCIKIDRCAYEDKSHHDIIFLCKRRLN